MAAWRIRKIYTVLGGAVLLGVLILATGVLEIPKGKTRKIQCLGDNLSAPQFIVPDLKGEKVDSAQFKGKVVLLNFWATWCPPCRREIPLFNELHRKYEKDGVVIIGISLDRSGPVEVQKFLEKEKVEYLNVLGDDELVEAFSRIAEMGPLPGIPTTFLIDRKGQICQRFVGLTDKKVFEEAIKQLL